MKTTLSPYLMFNGNCREAMEFYRSILGGELAMQTYGEAMPEETPEEFRDRIIHAALSNDALSFMASDGQPGTPVSFGDNVHLSIGGSDEEKLGEVFGRLSESGTVTIPLAKQFWGDTFGMLTDRFGVHWMVNVTSQPQG